MPSLVRCLRATGEGLTGTDDAMLLEACGYAVAVVEGDAGNFKVTTEDDMRRAEAVLAGRPGARSEPTDG